MKEQLEEIGNAQTLKDFKVKGNLVVLIFDNFKLRILPETYEEFKFVVGRDYKRDFLCQVIFINDKYTAEKYIISRVSRYMYSEYEAKQLLLKKFETVFSDAIDGAISDLCNDDVLNDEKYASQYKEYFDNSYYGKYYITNYLSLKHISQDIISELIFDSKLETEKCKKYFELIKNKYVSNNYAKQKKKIFDGLLKRGFGNDISLSFLASIKVDPYLEEKKLIRSYLKCKKKYETKKSDPNYKSITNKIISHLVYEGYEYNDIIRIIKKDEEGEIKND
jgi:SOS response regulatory protein OraA/RecX